LERHFCCIL